MADIIDRHVEAGIGHNRPPVPLTPDQVRAHLADEHVSLIIRRNELITAVSLFCIANPSIEDEETQGNASENLRMVETHLRHMEKTRVASKKPFKEAGDAVDAWFKGTRASLEDILPALTGRMTPYADRVEAERRAAAQAEAKRLQAVADEAAAVAAERMNADALNEATTAAVEADRAVAATAKPAASFTQTRGQFGAVASVSETWDFEVTDAMALVKAVAAGTVPLSCVAGSQTGIRAHLATLPPEGEAGAKTKSLPGVRVWVNRDMRTRR